MSGNGETRKASEPLRSETKAGTVARETKLSGRGGLGMILAQCLGLEPGYMVVPREWRQRRHSTVTVEERGSPPDRFFPGKDVHREAATPLLSVSVDWLGGANSWEVRHMGLD